ncbi:MAG TPA: acetylglutamate kinase [Phycisphaerales bacterium]|jgi:acetylglutamate kinase|nr:acetylglutamate kinase [Phycisphaerales bacterium]
MNIATEKAVALVEAHQYITRFRGKVVVVKVGGSIQEDRAKMRALMADIAFMSAVGMRPVVVHGGGKSITAAMDKAGLQARFIQGRRYTDARTLEIAERILVHEVNRELVEDLTDAGARAIGLHSLGSCVLFAERMYLQGQGGEKIDLGLVGTVTEVNTILLSALCEDGFIPVIAPVAIARQSGESPADHDKVSKLNVNADTAAGHVAAALKAEKLVVCSDTHGIRTDPKNPNSYASTLTRRDIDAMIASGVIGEGMLPKVEACLVAMAGGVPKTHIIDGRVPHSLLLEIYTDAGVGTQITWD